MRSSRAAANTVLFETINVSKSFGAFKATSDITLTFHAGTRRYQRALLEQMLRATGGNVSEAARRLDLTRGHIYTLMKTLGLDRS